MNLEAYYEYCLSKKGVTEHFPFDEETLVFKLSGKMFALTSLSQWERGKPSVNLKCDPGRAQELRVKYDDIQPGFHFAPVNADLNRLSHFNLAFGLAQLDPVG